MAQTFQAFERTWTLEFAPAIVEQIRTELGFDLFPVGDDSTGIAS
jgi:hypothetical protein